MNGGLCNRGEGCAFTPEKKKRKIAHVYDKNDKDNRAYTISPFTSQRTWLPALRTAYDKSEDAAPEHQPEYLQEL